MSVSPPRRFTVLAGGQAGAALPGKLISASATSGAHPDPLRDLVAAAAARKPDAIRSFLIAVGPHILRVVKGVLGPRDPDLEDVAQECSFALIDALPSFRGECAVVHFVRRITLLTALNARRHGRAIKRARERDATAEIDDFAGSDPGPEQAVAARASLALIRELLSTLPSGQAEALALHVMLGYTLSEMEEASGVPLETWKSRLRLAKSALKRRMLADPRGSELLSRSGEEAS